MPRYKKNIRKLPSYEAMAARLIPTYELQANAYNILLDKRINTNSGSRAANNTNNIQRSSNTQNINNTIQKPNSTGIQTKLTVLSNTNLGANTQTHPNPVLVKHNTLTLVKHQFNKDATLDVIEPSILDPRYNDWVKNRTELLKKEKEKYKNSPSFIYPVLNINNLINYYENIQNTDKSLSNPHKDKNGIAQESMTNRLKRRVFESENLGIVDKSKRLTNKEKQEIETYKMITDPVYAKTKIDQWGKDILAREKAELDRLNKILAEENYYGIDENDLIDPEGGLRNLFKLATSAWGKSFASDFIEKTNESQAQLSSGKITRANEFLRLSNSARSWTDYTKEYASNLYKLNITLQKLKNATGEQKLILSEIVNDLLLKNQDIRNKLADGKLYKDATNLASWESSSWLGDISRFVDGIIDDDIGGITANLGGLNENINIVQKLMLNKNHDEKWFKLVMSAINSTNNILEGFDNNAAKKQEGWREDYNTDIKDLNDWKSGNNWLGLHTNVDKYYKAQLAILEKTQYDWSNPMRTAMFGWSGIAGGSNSSWHKSAISLAANVAGFASGGASTAAVKIGGTLAATVVAFEANKSAGSDENNIESVNRAKTSLSNALRSEDKYDEFLLEGYTRLILKNNELSKLIKTLKDNGDNETLELYITDAFMSGAWHSSNPAITKMHHQSIIGSNNQFYNNQPVNTADAAVDAVVSTVRLAPIKSMISATKIAGNTVKRKFISSELGKQTINFGEKAGLKFSGVKQGVRGVLKKILDNSIVQGILNGSIKIGKKITDAGARVKDLSKLGIAPIRKKTLGIEREIAKQTAIVREFASRVPSAYLLASAVGKTAANITSRLAIESVSEMMQEGILGLNAKTDKLPYDEQRNRSIAFRIFDDILLGVDAANMFLHQGDPSFNSDAEVISSMNATPLLTLFGPGSIGVVLLAKGGYNEMKLNQVIANNIDAAKRGEKAQLEQAYEYAKHITADDRAAMHKKFDTFSKFAGINKKAKLDIAGLRRLQQMYTDEEIMNGTEIGIPQELIEELRKEYDEVYNLANSKIAQVVALRAGVDLSTSLVKNMFTLGKHGRRNRDKFARVVSMLNFRQLKRNDAFYDLLDTDVKINDVFHLTLSYDEDDVDQNNTEEAILNTAKSISELSMLYQMQEDYSALSSKTTQDNSILNKIPNRIKLIQKSLSKLGIEINSRDEAIEYLNNSKHGIMLLESLKFAKLNPELEAESIDNMSMEDVVNGLNQYQRERFIKEYNFLLYDRLLEDFMQNPADLLNAYRDARLSDEKLEQILEEDYLQSISKYEQASNREVKVGDIYVGKDGNWYIVKEEDINGKKKYVKHKYHPNTREIEKDAEVFDLLEYHHSKSTEEKALLEREARQSANKNMASISKDKKLNSSINKSLNEAHTEVDKEDDVEESINGTQPIVELTHVLDVVDEHITNESEEQNKEIFNVGEKVLVKDDNGNIISGQIINIDIETGETQILTPNGDVITTEHNNISNANPFNKRPKYLIGDTVSVNGRSAVINDYNIENINEDDLDSEFTYIIEYLDDNIIDKVSEDNISEFIEDESEISSEVYPNEAQLKVIDLLKEKQEIDKSIVKHDKKGNKITTGHNYFIKIKNKFIQFVRVHGILDPLFVENSFDKLQREELMKELYLIQLESTLALAERIKELLEKTNDDLSTYLTKYALEDEDTPIAISSIIYGQKPGVAVKVGSIIDEIARIYFSELELVNDPKYHMSDKTFNSIVSQLNSLKERFNQLEWIVDTNPYTWYSQMPNGLRLAGETDMIAIDRNGNIHILDFKTTRSKTRFNIVRQYKTVSPITGEETLQIIPDGVEAPEGVEVIISSDFINLIAPSKDNTGKRSYAAQYAMLLEAYRQMILQQTGIGVESLLVIPFLIDYNNHEDDIVSIDNVNVYDPVNLTEIPSLLTYITDVDNLLTIPVSTSYKEVKDLLEITEDLRDLIVSLMTNTENISDDVVYEINTHLQDVDNAILKLLFIVQNRHKMQDTILLKDALDSANKFEGLYEHISNLVNEDIYDNEENTTTEELETDVNYDENWEDSPLEILTDGEQLNWWQFNNLHSMSKTVVNMPKYMESIIKRDFIKNSIFKITRDSFGIFHANIEYRPIGQKVIKFNKDITIRLGNNATNPEDRNLDWASGQESVMARNLIRQYKLLFESLKPGEYIIAKNVKRTNGKLLYSLDTSGVNLMDTPFFDKQNPNWKSMLNDVDSLIGVVDLNGTVVEITSGDRLPILYPSQDKDGNLKLKFYEPKPGNQKSEGIPAGSVIYLHKFKNEEDSINDEERKVPILLKGKKLSEKDINLIIYTISNYSKWNENIPMRITRKDGSISTETIPGFTYQKAMKLLVRFGDLAIFAGDEFVFGYAMNDDLEHVSGHKMVTVTDMLLDAKEVVDEETGELKLKRPIVTLDLNSDGDVQHLRDILKTIDVHINQIGIMRSNLNSDDESSIVGMLGSYFKQDSNSDVLSVAANETIKFDAEDVLSDKNDINEGLPIIAWQIKHGIAKTQAQSLLNPLISITELEKTNDSKIKSEKKEQENISKEEVVSAIDGQKDSVDEVLDIVQQEIVEESNPVKEEFKEKDKKTKESKIEDISLDDIMAVLGQEDPNDIPEGFGLNRTIEKLPQKPISEHRKLEIKKRIKKLIGNFEVKFTDAATMAFKYGANVAGRLAQDAMVLNENLPEGTEYHEAFHRILEILVPNKIRESIYSEYRKKYGANYKKVNGYDLTDVVISEGMAELFRDFQTSRTHVKLHFNLIRTFNEIYQYINAIKELGSRKFAMLFIAANSGIFKYLKPNAENLKHFNEVLGGSANMRVSGVVSGKVKTIDLTEFPIFGGKAIYDDAISGLVYSLIRGYSIDDIANNASRISTKRIDITNNLFRKNENTEHSTWFRVLTGEYANQGEKITVYDAIMYRNIYKNTDEIKQIAIDVIKNNKNKTKQELQAIVLLEVMNIMAQQTPDTINQNQKMMALLLSEETWPIVEKAINLKLSKIGVDSLKRYNKDLELDEKANDENVIFNDANAHRDIFYDHARSEDASAAVKFLLSTIPDEHFATQSDVDAGLVPSTVDKDGNPILVPNSTNTLGYKQFLNMNAVSNKLLIACHDVSSAEELDEKLLSLKDQHPIFYRLSKKYHSFLTDSIIKTKDGKNEITVNRKKVNPASYNLHYDEDGVYYTYVKDGSDTNERIKDAVTSINTAKEAFVTQLFNYVSCQRLDFIQTVLEQVVDEDGNEIEGKYTARVLSTDSDYAATVIPREWFVKLRSGVSGIFYVTDKGRFAMSKEGRDLLVKSILSLSDILKHYTTNTKLIVDGKTFNKLNESDFRYIELIFIESLNNLGIDITKELLEFKLNDYYKIDQTGQTLLNAFGRMITSAKVDLSFKAFMDMLHRMLKGVSVSGENVIITNSKPEERTGRKGSVSISYATGINMYSDNAFIKWLAQGVSRYNKLLKQLMTNGPGGTQQYTMAQSHTASDFTQDYNKASVSKDGNVTGSKILKDMMKYTYNFSKRVINSSLGLYTQNIGSLIIKHLLNDSHAKLVLKNNTGVRVLDDYNGGVSYKEIIEREDYIAKVAILLQGGIIFPTLSDKGTWFYISGVNVPGLNYRSLSSISSKDLLHLGLHVGQDVSSGNAHILFDFNKSNAQLDQMIEYAFCERNQIEKEINRKNVLNIKFWKDNRKRFAGLTEIMLADGTVLLLNDYDKTPEECLKFADLVFFGDHITDIQRRKMMALTLEAGLMENLSLLERNGLIVASNDLKENVLDSFGNNTGLIRTASRLFQYKNVGLDSKVIDSLRATYIAEMAKENNPTVELVLKAESLAIIQYVWDIYMRSIISNEEVERMYTGAPLFFKWKNEKIKDSISNRKMNVLVDRHVDQSKRLGGLGSTGEKNRIGLPDIKETYVCTEIKDLMVLSKLINELKLAFIDNEVRLAYLDFKQNAILSNNELNELQKTEALDQLNDEIYILKKSISEIKEELDSYNENVYKLAVSVGEKKASTYGIDSKGNGKINVADGAAYITPKMTKNLLRQRGVYTTKVKEAFEYLEGKKIDGKYVNTFRDKQAYKIVMDALLGAQKYSAYGYRIDDAMPDVPIHYYDKFALFPLFENMATGMTQIVLLKMKLLGVDMLMMDSAVKTGSLDATELNEDIISNKEFKFKTYKQKYQFIRRQLNTDPHEHESVAMGTQMTKIALSNLNENRLYTLYDGTLVRGRDLLKTIMQNINDLSDIGYEEIKLEMFENGKFNIDKFSKFLRQELESRDADENLIDGIEVVDGDFKIPLEAMSSVDWILSILVSKINKSVIDINVKGNAFYQRSVWGVEGKPTILSSDDPMYKTSSINDGEDLLVVNEDGSMDGVISIDFFLDIIPAGIRYDFEKAKKWLIDNEIIGKNAKANTIISRIPTLAQSSIHAVRFVDVLPVMRDTIILPKEFTAITGSDFDIDKLYLSRKSYSVKTTKTEDGKIIDTVTSIFDKDKNMKDYCRNSLIDGYITLLKDHGKYDKQNGFSIGNTINISLRSIDDDTNLIKQVLNRIESDKPKERYYAYKFGNLAFLVATKAQFIAGKFGIGPFALNNNNLILTQLYGIKFDEKINGILTELDINDLSKHKDKLGNSILSWLSGLINAHVDVAKDPYIARLGVNKFTYNVVNLLIRGGIGDRTLLFTALPVMKELSRVYEYASSSYMVDQTKSTASRLRNAIKDFIIDSFNRSTSGTYDIKFINSMLNYDDETTEMIVSSYAKELFGIDNNGELKNTFKYIDPVSGSIIEKQGSIFEDILTNKDVLLNDKKPISLDNLSDKLSLYRLLVKNEVGEIINVDLTPMQVLLYIALVLNQLSPYALKLSDLVNVCKIDTKKHGKNYVEQSAFLDKYKDVFENEDGVFEQEGLDRLRKDSYVEKKTKNATELYSDILKNISILSTDQFKQIHDEIIESLNSSSQNKELSKKVCKAIMSYLKTKFFDNEVITKLITERENENYANDLFYGNNTVQDNLIRLLNMLKRDKNGEFKLYVKGGVITNPLIKALQSDFYEDRDGYNNPKFIKLENSLLDDSDNVNAIERAWDDLFNDEKHYIKVGDKLITFRLFAIDLAIYAFYTSGDNVGLTKFFKYVPNTIRQYLGYSEYIRNISNLFLNGVYSFDKDVVNQIIFNNWQDDDFVKQIKPVRKFGKHNVAMIHVGGTVENSTKKVVRTNKGRFISKTITTKINTLIAAYRKSNNGTIVTVHTNNSGKFPPYIKIRRPNTDRFASDNILLYELHSIGHSVNGAESQTYPIYRIVLPKTVRLRAGSYNYDMIRPNNTKYNAYPTFLSETIEKVFNSESIVTESIDSGLSENKRIDRLTDRFIEELQNQSIVFDYENIYEMISREFEHHGLDVSKNKLEKSVDYILNKIGDNRLDSKKLNKSDNNKDIDMSVLGNTYHRPFDRDGIRFLNVYQANVYYRLKFAETSQKEINNARLEILEVSDVKQLKGITGRFKYKQGKDIDNLMAQDILNNMYQSFKLNPNALSKLMSTGIDPIEISTPSINNLLMLTRDNLMKEQDLQKDNELQFDPKYMNNCKNQ